MSVRPHSICVATFIVAFNHVKREESKAIVWGRSLVFMAAGLGEFRKKGINIIYNNCTFPF
jgi:hypothetical protein